MPIELKFNAATDEETYKGKLAFNGYRGMLESNKKRFLHASPIYRIRSNIYTVVAVYDVMYAIKINEEVVEGKIYAYYNRNSLNPTSKEPIAYFISTN